MQVTLKINDRGNVRDALPLRAISDVTSWGTSPDSIVRALAEPKTTRVGSLEIRNRHNELFAYQMDSQGRYEQVPPEQWEPIVNTLDILTEKLQAYEREDIENENYGPWKLLATLELPDNVFIWLDEFQRWYSTTRPLKDTDDYLKWERNQERLNAKRQEPGSKLTESEWEMLDEASPQSVQESDKLCLSPILPHDIENRVWRYAEGFDATKPEGLQESIVIHQQPVAAREQVVVHHHHYPPQAAADTGTPAAPKVEVVTVMQTDEPKPWLIADPADPEPDYSWYTPARYFARQLVIHDSTLLTKRDLLADKVVQSLTNAGIKKRGNKPFGCGTILKAFTNVSLG